MATAVDIKDILVAASVGGFAGTTGWQINISREAASPHTVITIYNSGSWQEASAKWKIDFPTLQIRVRGNPDGWLAAESKMAEVSNTLLGLTPQTVNNTDYRGIWKSGDTFQLAYDETSRPILVQNFRVASEPSSTVSDNRLSL